MMRSYFFSVFAIFGFLIHPIHSVTAEPSPFFQSENSCGCPHELEGNHGDIFHSPVEAFIKNQTTTCSISNPKFRSFLIFGPPGAGKGTIGKLISERAGLIHLSSGDLFRSLSPDSSSGKQIRSYLDQGKLVPDEVTIAIWRNHVDKLIADNHYNPNAQFLLLDGIPRTVAQAEELKKHTYIEGIILLEVKDDAVLIDRLKIRAQKEGRRDDNSEEVLRTRFSIYNKETKKVLDYYDPKIIHRINAEQNISSVLYDVLQSLENYFFLKKGKR